MRHTGPDLLLPRDLLATRARELSGKTLTEAQKDKFSAYYRLVLRWNPRLHLTTITRPDEFCARHILESLIASENILFPVSRFYDMGAGMGVPGIPVAILNPDLPVTMVEASNKKTVFLKEAIAELGLENTKAHAGRIEEMSELAAGACVAARAVEKMEQVVRDIFGIGAGARQFLFFGGKELEDRVSTEAPPGMTIRKVLLPDADARYLFSVERST
ncbi:MAG: 16S rRNA (guanine(527)-N(7))-methyltransferase RsmG [Blastocatellia bacterium]